MKHVPKGLRQLDHFGRQAANALGTVAEDGALASNQFQNNGLSNASNKVVKHAESIHNFTRSAQGLPNCKTCVRSLFIFFL